MVLCRTRGGLVVLGGLCLGLAVLLLGGLVELVGDGLLVLAIEVLVRVGNALLVRRSGVLVGLAGRFALVSAAPVVVAKKNKPRLVSRVKRVLKRDAQATNRCIRVWDLVDIVVAGETCSWKA